MIAVPATRRTAPVDIDANVWVASHLPSERGHTVAARLVTTVLSDEIRMEQPAITLVEVASALRRRGTIRAEVEQRVAWLASLPGAVYHDLDVRAAIQAASTAMLTGLRAADAIYLATARATGATLITFDTELQTARLPGARVMSPEAWLAARG